MPDLPSPARFLTVEAFTANPKQYLEEIKDGGVIVLMADDGREFVITADAATLSEARIAAMIENGSLPSLDALEPHDVAELADKAGRAKVARGRRIRRR